MKKLKLIDVFAGVPLGVRIDADFFGEDFQYRIDFSEPQPWLLWPPSVGLPSPELPEWGVWEFMNKNFMLTGEEFANHYKDECTYAYRLKALAKGWTDDPSEAAA